MRKLYWYISTFFRKHGVIVLTSIIGAVIIFSVFLPFAVQKLNFKHRRYIGVVGWSTLDTLPKEIQEKMSLGLTQLSEDGSATPGLAERWTVEDDGKTYRFLLKQHLKWQDGQAVEPADLNYTFKDVQIITNQNEIIFKLKDPFSPFPTTVAQPVFRHSSVPYLFFFKKRTLIGIGSYHLSSYQEKEGGDRLTQLVLDSSKEQLIYRFYLTESDAVDGFQRGEIDELHNLSDAGDIGTWKTIKVQKTIDKTKYLAVFFNLGNELFNKDARLALNYAIEKPSDETRIASPISPLSWAYADVAKIYDFDKTRAIDRLLSTNGIPHKQMHFVLTTTSNFITDAENMKNAWQQLGQDASVVCQKTPDIKDKQLCENVKIIVDIKVNNFPDTNNYDAILIGQTVPIDPDQYQLWHSDQPSNFTHYSNTRIDSLLERGRQTVDQRKRAEIYSDFQQFFSEDPPTIFLRYLDRYSIQRH